MLEQHAAYATEYEAILATARAAGLSEHEIGIALQAWDESGAKPSLAALRINIMRLIERADHGY